jgi:uncharacterized protein (DUF488 family)
MSAAAEGTPVVWSIGHSTRTLAELVDLLSAHGMRAVADVRALPRSRRHPHFACECLERELPGHGIAYRHLPALGGLRRPNGDGLNAGWRNPAFRGFADHMQSAEFQAGLKDLRHGARQAPTAMMCAEAAPWRCHRSLIADALTALGVRVEHILEHANLRTHRLTPGARVALGRVIYPAVQRELESGTGGARQ